MVVPFIVTDTTDVSTMKAEVVKFWPGSITLPSRSHHDIVLAAIGPGSGPCLRWPPSSSAGCCHSSVAVLILIGPDLLGDDIDLEIHQDRLVTRHPQSQAAPGSDIQVHCCSTATCLTR